MVEVRNVVLEGRRLSGLIDGVSAWFDFPANVEIERRGDPFLAYAILLGQFRGERITIDAPISPRVLKNLPKVQSLLKLWNPAFSEVEIEAPTEPVTRLNPGMAACFSGGVDSAYTVARNPEITHLVTLNGFDWHAPEEPFEPVKSKLQATAAKLGKTFLPIETNVREVASVLKISWAYLHGPFLNLIASSLGFDRFYISSSHTYREMHPWGSHPLLDPLWGSEVTNIVHYGADKWRTQKIESISNNAVLLDQLQVCSFESTRNCGQCSKCARTQLALKLLGVKGPIPDAPVPDLIRKLDLKNDGTASFIWDLGRLARERGATDIQVLLDRKLRYYTVKRAVRQFKRLFRPKRLKPGVVRLGPPVLF
jgi:hypothetical protein